MTLTFADAAERDGVTRIAVQTNAVGILASNIRARAARLAFNQSDLARAIGVTPQSVSLKWYGKRAWSVSDLDRVAAALGTTPWELMTPAPGDVWRPRPDSNREPADYGWGLAA